MFWNFIYYFWPSFLLFRRLIIWPKIKIKATPAMMKNKSALIIWPAHLLAAIILPARSRSKRKQNKYLAGKNNRPIFHTKQEKSSCNVTTLTMERLIAWLFLRAKRPEQSGGRSGSKIKTRRPKMKRKERRAHKIIGRQQINKEQRRINSGPKQRRRSKNNNGRY